MTSTNSASGKGINYDRAAQIAGSLSTKEGYAINGGQSSQLATVYALLAIADAVRQAAPTSPAEAAW